MTIAACSAFCMQIRVYITISLWGLITVSGPSLNLLRQHIDFNNSSIQVHKNTYCIWTHTHTLTRGQSWSRMSVFFALWLDCSHLRLQEQIYNNNFKDCSGVNNPPHPERNHLFTQEIHKAHRVPNYLFFCLREETSETEIKPNI